MDVFFATRKLEKSVHDLRSIQKNYGKQAKQVNQRLSQLRAVKNLEEMRGLVQANCHELTGGRRKGTLAVNVSRNHRIIFRPQEMPPPQKEDGGLHWAAVEGIVILQIATDYH